MILLYRIGEAAKRLGVCTKTIRRWDAAGKIQCHRTLGGHRRISRREIERVLTHPVAPSTLSGQSQIAIYCRVSSHDQKKNGDLARQIAAAEEFCHQNHLKPNYIFHDVSSGLNTRRSGLKKLCPLRIPIASRALALRISRGTFKATAPRSWRSTNSRPARCKRSWSRISSPSSPRFRGVCMGCGPIARHDSASDRQRW